MKVEFIDDDNKCDLIALPEEGLISVHPWVFDKLENTDQKNLYKLNIKWLATIKQGNNDLVTIWHCDNWYVLYENTNEEKEILTKIYEGGYNVFMAVFDEYCERLDYDKLTITRYDNIISDSVDTLLQTMQAAYLP